MAGGNKRKRASVVILHLCILLLTKGRRFLFCTFAGVGGGRGEQNGHRGWNSLDMLFSRNVISVEEVISVKMTFPKPFSESFIASSTAKLPGRKGLLKPACTWPSLCPHSRHFILKPAASPLDGKGSSLVP